MLKAPLEIILTLACTKTGPLFLRIIAITVSFAKKSHKMKKIITSVVALMVMGSVSFAQDTKKAETKKTTKKTETKTESKDGMKTTKKEESTKTTSKDGGAKTKSKKKTETSTETKAK